MRSSRKAWDEVVYRTIDTSLWDDPKVKSLSTLEKLAFVYLISNRHSHVSGIYVLPTVLACHETALRPEEWDRVSDTLSGLGLCRFDAERELVWVVNMFDYQGKGEKNERAAAKHIPSLHKSPVVNEFLKRYPTVARFLSDRVSGRVSDRVSGVGTQEQEQEQKKKNPPTPPKGRNTDNGEYTSEFLTFWQAYPRKVGKGAAWSRWRRMKRPPLQTLLQAVQAQANSEQWLRDGGQFIPHPATWLNQRRWEDEPAQRNASRHNGRTALPPGHPCHGRKKGERWKDDDGTEHQIGTDGWWWIRTPDSEPARKEKLL